MLIDAPIRIEEDSISINLKEFGYKKHDKWITFVPLEKEGRVLCKRKKNITVLNDIYTKNISYALGEKKECSFKVVKEDDPNYIDIQSDILSGSVDTVWIRNFSFVPVPLFPRFKIGCFLDPVVLNVFIKSYHASELQSEKILYLEGSRQYIVNTILHRSLHIYNTIFAFKSLKSMEAPMEKKSLSMSYDWGSLVATGELLQNGLINLNIKAHIGQHKIFILSSDSSGISMERMLLFLRNIAPSVPIGACQLPQCSTTQETRTTIIIGDKVATHSPFSTSYLDGSFYIFKPDKMIVTEALNIEEMVRDIVQTIGRMGNAAYSQEYKDAVKIEE